MFNILGMFDNILSVLSALREPNEPESEQQTNDKFNSATNNQKNSSEIKARKEELKNHRRQNSASNDKTKS